VILGRAMSHVKHRPRHTGPVRVTIRVRPGAGRTVVGGEHDGALVVRVTARAVEGRATEAALAALARAFGLRRTAVTLVTGATSRTKVVDVAGATEERLRALLASWGRLRAPAHSSSWWQSQSHS
jgi:uncharacterized protein